MVCRTEAKEGYYLAEKIHNLCSNYSVNTNVVDSEYLKDKMRQVRHYTRINGRLKQAIEKGINLKDEEKYCLEEELSLARSLLEEAAIEYEKAMELPIDNIHRLPLLATAQSMISDALKQLRETMRVSSEIYINHKGKYSAQAVYDVVNQIKMFAVVAFNDNKALDKLNEYINEQLFLPKIGVEGVNITPEQDVREMIDSVPEVIEGVAVGLSEQAQYKFDCPQCSTEYEYPELIELLCPTCNVVLNNKQ